MIDMLELLTRPWTVMIIVFSLARLYQNHTAKSKTPNIPWVGRDSRKWFADFQASVSSFGNGLQLLNYGYRKACLSPSNPIDAYTKKGISYLIPDLNGGPSMVIPPSQLSWVTDQPDHVLSASAFHYDTLGEDYAFTHPRILRDPYHERIIHRTLPRRIPALIPDIQDELAVAFDEVWGTDAQGWKEIQLYDTMLIVISRVVNRMIVGLPLCRNEDFLSNMRAFASTIPITGLIIGYTPKWLKPIVGRLAAVPSHIRHREMAKHIVPIVTQRLAKFEKKETDPSYQWEPPNDCISWLIEMAKAEDREDELTVDMLSRRVMPIEFATIHTTSISTTHCLLDLFSSDPSLNFLEGIREQSIAILAENDGQWTKANLANATRADSAFRESMRSSSFITRSVTRKVMARNGITNPAEGWKAPFGAVLGFDAQDLHHDPDLYSKPDFYDAFRFSRGTETKERDGAKASSSPDHDEESTLKRKNISMVTTSDTFLPWGHGRHACPGRFFVASEAKMMLAYMVMNYEIEPLPSKPADKIIGSIILPSPTATVRIRRRPGTV